MSRNNAISPQNVPLPASPETKRIDLPAEDLILSRRRIPSHAITIPGPTPSVPTASSTVASSVDSPSAHWWGNRHLDRRPSRPWQSGQHRRRTIPPEQTEAFRRTAAAVSKATGATLRTGLDVIHETLRAGVELLDLAPVPGLAPAARTLLNIWDSVEGVESNRLACLGLTERCANILIAVRLEVHAAGDEVTDTLAGPIAKLNSSFENIAQLMQKQADRPFLKRYLKRDDIASKIDDCHASLTDAVSLFSLSVQIRTLQQLQEAERARHNETAAILAALTPTPSRTALPPISLEEVVTSIEQLRKRQARLDAAKDAQDLLETMRTALRTSSDAAMVDILQVQRHEMAEAIKTLQRALEDPKQTEDPFHKEFLEGGLDSLRRMSGDREMPLPSWTITRWEVDRDAHIGIGFFSEVYRGTWRGRTVAIKVLAPTTPRNLFRHEVEIWQTLKHNHVLELLGASSTSSNPPWFLVSPYMKNGSLVTFLKKHPNKVDPLQMIHEIALGMRYLHEMEVLHGDLKASNVLMDDDLHCQITDFGQSEMKNEAWRLSGSPLISKGTLRWTAPEAIDAQGRLTPEMDVYSFSICCIEILTKGELPWPRLDDMMVRRLVLEQDLRPTLPLSQHLSLGLMTLIKACWQRLPTSRPSFEMIVRDTGVLLSGIGGTPSEDSLPNKHLALADEADVHHSPDLRPIELLEEEQAPVVSVEPVTASPTTSLRTRSSTASFLTAELTSEDIPIQEVLSPLKELPHPQKEERDETAPLSAVSDAGSTSLFTALSSQHSSHGENDRRGDETPPPMDEASLARRDERGYRLHLRHDFEKSLILPLFSPSPVGIGAVGYLSKPRGNFVTLMNAFDPSGSSRGRAKRVPALAGYGKVEVQSIRRDVRNAALRGLDMITAGFLTFKARGLGTYSESVARRYTLPLQAGEKSAFLVTETTMYQWMSDTDVPKLWFAENVDTLLKIYGTEHRIQKEDIALVIGALNAPDWAIFVNHHSSSGQVHFNVLSDTRVPRWGTFSTDSMSTPPTSSVVPSNDASIPDLPPTISKISNRHHGDTAWDSVLLARLRFKPDENQPTSL